MMEEHGLEYSEIIAKKGRPDGPSDPVSIRPDEPSDPMSIRPDDHPVRTELPVSIPDTEASQEE
jgi:hypothetical protein